MTDFEAGVFVIDKPVGPTSFRIVQQVRRALGIKKVGHAGTLDPFASGLLLVCAGRPATKIISVLMDGDKVYEAVMRLGVETDTHDLEGSITAEKSVGHIETAVIDKWLSHFVGEQHQVPPAFSAVKHKGKPLYYYARKGVIIEKPARKIMIKSISRLAFNGTELSIKVECSKGTYIRTLASDIGKALGCGAHLIQLRRTRSGCFSVDESINGKDLNDKDIGKNLLLSNLLSVQDAVGRSSS